MMMQHSNTVSSAAKRGVVVGLQGPRPLPLSLPGTGTTSSSASPPRPAKRPRVVNGRGGNDDGGAGVGGGPVIVYEHTPKVIHARPDEFKALVQRLTGRPQPTGTGGAGDQDVVLRPAAQTAVPPPSESQQDPLVLTLGQQQVLPLDGQHHTPPVLSSPGAGAAGGGFLLSPGSFLFSPATMQAIHELISS